MLAGVLISRNLFGKSEYVLEGAVSRQRLVAVLLEDFGVVPDGALVPRLHQDAVELAIDSPQVDNLLGVFGLYLVFQAGTPGQRRQLAFPREVLKYSERGWKSYVRGVTPGHTRRQNRIDVTRAGELHVGAGVGLPLLDHRFEVGLLLGAPDAQHIDGLAGQIG